MIHLMTGALYGAVLGLAVARLRLDAVMLMVVGVTYGAVVFAASAFVGLPLAAEAFGVDDLAEGAMAGMNPVADMAEMAGWGVFFSEHLLFGLVAALVIAVGQHRRA